MRWPYTPLCSYPCVTLCNSVNDVNFNDLTRNIITVSTATVALNILNYVHV